MTIKPLVGHAEAMAHADPVPHAVLVTGPEGVGKRLAVEHLAQRTGARKLDFLRLGHLNAERARQMIEHHSIRPLSGPRKVSTADITRSSGEAVNAILKLLEEPPPYSHIILHSDGNPLLTIRSRCMEVRFGTLTTGEVAEVLEREGFSEAEAFEAANESQGRVSLALRYSSLKDSRSALAAVLAAVASQDADALENALSGVLRAKEKEAVPEVEQRREALCEALVWVLRGSLTHPGDENPLQRVRIPSRLAAIRILTGASRPTLRLRSAAWVLFSGREK